MISLEDILNLHQKSIELFGGSHGIREVNLLESAISRPFQTFGGKDLYPSIIAKAASLGESLIKNHPFVDGNKRTGMLAMYAFLLAHGFNINVSNSEFYQFIIDIATGDKHFEDIVIWLEKNTEKK